MVNALKLSRTIHLMEKEYTDTMIGEKNKTVILPIIAKNGRSHQIFVNLEQM